MSYFSLYFSLFLVALYKNFAGDAEALLQSFGVQFAQQMRVVGVGKFSKIIDQPFGIHIPYQFVSRHRAAADAFQGAVESPAAGLESRIDLCLTIVVGGGQVYAEGLAGQLFFEGIRHREYL